MRNVLVASIFALSCAHTQDGLTVAEHRNQARLHEQQAAAERAQYDPRLDRTVPVRGPAKELPDFDTASYNPTVGHLYNADREMREAAAHLRAAKRLELFEDARCKDLAPEARSACPLLASSVTRVVETPRGIVLYLKPEVDTVDTHRRLDCHLAYARAEGFTRPSCPLFVKGMSITLELQPLRAIDMFADEPKAAEEIKVQARRIFIGELPVTVR